MKLLLVLVLVLILILSVDVDDTTAFDERVGIVRDRLGGRVGPRWRDGGLGRGFQESCKNVCMCEYTFIYVCAENASPEVRDNMKSRHHDCYSSDEDAEKENTRENNNKNNEEELLMGLHIPCI